MSKLYWCTMVFIKKMNNLEEVMERDIYRTFLRYTQCFGMSNSKIIAIKL